MRQAVCRRVVAAALVLVALLGFAAANPYAAHAVGDVSASNVFTLPVPASQKSYASSSGNVVVWEERSGNYGYDRSAKELFRVPVPADAITGPPTISGKWIVFDIYNHMDLWAYDRSTDTTVVVAADGISDGNQAISGDTVVWVSPNESDDADIFGKNLATGETFTVTAAPAGQCSPDIEGDWVVYLDFTDQRYPITKAYNIKTRATTTLCGWKGDQGSPKISSTGFAVWHYAGDLYGRYVTGGAIRRIAGGPKMQHDPTIGGNIIVYKDEARPGGYGLVGYDLLSGTRFGISKGIGSDYYIAGIQDGTIARLYTPGTDYWRTTVQLIWPTQLEVISDESAVSESVDAGDHGLLPEPIVAASMFGRTAVSSAASRVSTVVISASSDWQSAALACSLAGRRSPLLFTNKTSVPASVLAKLAALAPQRVVVVGGPSSVSAAAVRQLMAVVGADAVSRVAGTDPKTRSLTVARTVAARPGWTGTVIVASGDSASSALMAVPASVWKGLPLVLSDAKSLSTAQIRGLMSAGAKRFVVVSSVVSATTVARLRKAVGSSRVKIIAGPDVASTSAKFASWEVSSCGMAWHGLGIASKSSWSRTLAAALSKGRAGSVLLMTDPKTLSAPVKVALVAHHRAIRRVSFVGTTTFVSTRVRSQVRLAIK